MSESGVSDLAGDLRELQERYGLDQATASMRLPGEVIITLALRGDLLTIESNGEVVVFEMAA